MFRQNNKVESAGKKSLPYAILLFIIVLSLNQSSAAAPEDTMHINLQVLDGSGAIQTGTFSMTFNLSTDSNCASPFYSNTTSQTTDNSGRVSLNLANIQNNLTNQSYLAYARDGVLQSCAPIGKVPYSFNADNSQNWFGKAISYLRAIATGNKNQNSLLSRHLDLAEFNTGVTQNVTMVGGAALPHSVTKVGEKIFVGTIQAPAQFIRFNDMNDLTNQTTFTFDSDGDHDYASSMVYDKGTNRIYVIFGNGNVPGTDRLVIAAVNPDTLEWEDVIINTGTAPGSTTGPSIESDGTHLYTVSATGNSTVSKYLLSNYTLVAQKNMTGFGNGHAMQYDFDTVGRLYITGVNSWIVKMNTSDLTFTNISIPTIQAFTDDLTMAGDWIYLGAEFSENIVLKVNKNNLSNYERIYISSPANVWSLYFDGTWVWVATSATAGTLIRIDPMTSDIAYYDLGTGNTPNEILTDGQRLFMTTFTTPGQMFRISTPNMQAQLRTRAGIVYNFAQRYSSADMDPRDYMIMVRNVTGGHTVSLYDLAYIAPGREIVVQDVTGVAGTGGNITIQGYDTSGEGSGPWQQINGQDSMNITTAYGAVTLVSNGTAWFARRN